MRMRPGSLPALFLGVCAGMVASACDFAQDKADASAFGERYFAAATNSEISAVLPLYSPRFFAVTPRETWLGELQRVRDRCGTPSTHELENWAVNHKFGVDAGRTVKLIYEVKYQRCRITETLVVFSPAEGGFSIVGHLFHLNDAAPSGSGQTTTV